MSDREQGIPDYWFEQPIWDLSAADAHACDALLAQAVAQGADVPFAYTLAIPKWRFLCYVAEQHPIALHGSQNSTITRFEPRQPFDHTEFGNQNAVYAAADGIWPMYFAIVDRDKSPSIINACLRLEDEQGVMSAPYYFFSISQNAVAQQPYNHGMVYLLPRATFMTQPPFENGSWRIHIAQLASLEAVTPLAKLEIAPEDFPFLAQMRTHDDTRLGEYAEAMTKGLPWPE